MGYGVKGMYGVRTMAYGYVGMVNALCRIHGYKHGYGVGGKWVCGYVGMVNAL